MRILSIDGGGIRGIIPAVWLDVIESGVGHPLNSSFDLIAGTSTGAILAAGVSLGVAPRVMIDLFLSKRYDVFPPRWNRFKSRVRRSLSYGISVPKYDGRGLDTVLKEILGEKTLLGDAKTQLLVTSYDVRRRLPVVFDSRISEHADKPMWAICRASASAPTYFPAQNFSFRAVHPLIDGGVVANNPTVVAIASAAQRLCGRGLPTNRLLVTSLGTGHCTREITIRQSQAWGPLQWAVPLLDVMFDGSASINDWIARQIIPNGKYVRLQVELRRGSDTMDDVSGTNVNNLLSLAETYLTLPQGQRNLELLLSMLRDESAATGS